MPMHKMGVRLRRIGFLPAFADKRFQGWTIPGTEEVEPCRATPRMAEVEQRREHDCREAGGRVTHGAVTELPEQRPRNRNGADRERRIRVEDPLTPTRCLDSPLNDPRSPPTSFMPGRYPGSFRRDRLALPWEFGYETTKNQPFSRAGDGRRPATESTTRGARRTGRRRTATFHRQSRAGGDPDRRRRIATGESSTAKRRSSASPSRTRASSLVASPSPRSWTGARW